MKSLKMDKINYTSAEHAHWRIDEIVNTVGELTKVVQDHDQELAAIRSMHKSVKIAGYTIAGTLLAGEVGLFEVVRKYIGV